MDKKSIKKKAQDFVQYLIKTHRLPVERAYLYGSYASGHAGLWSDIDVCIVSPLFRSEDAVSYLWKKRRSVDVEDMLAPVGFSPEDFSEQTPSPLVHSIITTGELLLG